MPDSRNRTAVRTLPQVRPPACRMLAKVGSNDYRLGTRRLRNGRDRSLQTCHSFPIGKRYVEAMNRNQEVRARPGVKTIEGINSAAEAKSAGGRTGQFSAVPRYQSGQERSISPPAFPYFNDSQDVLGPLATNRVRDD